MSKEPESQKNRGNTDVKMSKKANQNTKTINVCQAFQF